MNRPRSSRQRYLSFVKDYRRRRLDEEGQNRSESEDPASKPRGKRREYLRDYLRWLWPRRYAAGALLVLALLGAGLHGRTAVHAVYPSMRSPRKPSLQGYHLLPSVRSGLLARLGRFDEAGVDWRLNATRATVTKAAPSRTLRAFQASRLRLSLATPVCRCSPAFA